MEIFLFLHKKHNINGLVQKKCNSSANALELHFFVLTHWYEVVDIDNALELHLFCINPLIWSKWHC